MEKEKRIKVLFDTNIWVSFFLGGEKSLMHDLILDKRLEIYASNELAEELFETLKNRKFEKIVNKFLLNNFKILFYESVVFVIPCKEIKLCRDPKDDFLLAVALEAKTDYLVTGDHDLLELDKKAGIKIMKPADLHKILFKPGKRK